MAMKKAVKRAPAVPMPRARMAPRMQAPGMMGPATTPMMQGYAKGGKAKMGSKMKKGKSH